MMLINVYILLPGLSDGRLFDVNGLSELRKSDSFCDRDTTSARYLFTETQSPHPSTPL